MNVKATQRTILIGMLCAAMCSVACIGCGNKDGRPVHVGGQVQLDGKPLSGGSIRVVPGHGRAAAGQIDSDGRFTLARYKSDDGCLPGAYRVEVIPVIVENAKTSAVIPQKYANVETSGLTVKIDGPTDALKIDLSTKNQ